MRVVRAAAVMFLLAAPAYAQTPNVNLIPELQLIADAAHLHHSRPHFSDEFNQLASRMGAADFDSVLSDENGMAEW